MHAFLSAEMVELGIPSSHIASPKVPHEHHYPARRPSPRAKLINPVQLYFTSAISKGQIVLNAPELSSYACVS
jgi:hypothetical protein